MQWTYNRILIYLTYLKSKIIGPYSFDAFISVTYGSMQLVIFTA